MDRSNYKNPFPNDPDRNEIWEMLVERDTIAFCNADWGAVADDFVEDAFMGVDGGGKTNPDAWILKYPRLEDYKNEWLRQAKDFKSKEWKGDVEEDFYNATILRDIDINGASALIHKKFDGKVEQVDGSVQYLNWQTLYRCQKVDGKWKIQGFTGYLPFPLMGGKPATNIGISIPDKAAQHKTAGPYSPVLEVNPASLVVISGQAAIDLEGTVIGDTIEEQTHVTMKNCENQLLNAGCDLNDVFKVNVFLTDLDNWPRFNEVYKTYFNAPLPVRTAVQTPLLMTLLVEIEMWAVKK